MAIFRGPLYLNLKSDHPLGDLKIDMIVTTSQRVHLYGSVQQTLSGKAKGFSEVINADQVSIDQIFDAVRATYLSPAIDT
jgi:hypothetical protein